MAKNKKHSQAKNTFGSLNSSYKSWQIFNGQVNLLEEAAKIVYSSGGDTNATIFPLLYAIIDTCKSIALLAPSGKARDIFVLARTVLETTINVCYTYAVGSDAVEKLSKHAKQKAVRDLSRELKFNSRSISLTWSGLSELKLNAKLSAAMNEFTTSRGKEERKWTPEGIVRRLEIIEKKYGERIGSSLAFGIFAIYRHASEVTHGTLFGVLFVLGMTLPNWNKVDLEKIYIGNLQMLLIILGYVISALILVLAKELKADNLVQKTSALVEETEKLVKK